MRRFLPTLAVVVCGYAGTLAGYLSLRFTGDALPAVTLLGHFEPWLTGGALLLLPFALMKRIPWAALVLGLGAALGVGLHAPLVMEALQGPPAVGEPADFTVLTWNTGLGRASEEQVVAALAEDPADIVTLQELPLEHFSAIEAQLAERYPYREYRGEGEHSLAVLARVPIDEFAWIVPEHGNPWMEFSANLGGEDVAFVALHLSARVALLSRYAPASDHLEQMCEREGPTVLLGDFNMTHRTGEYQRIVERGYEDAFDTAGSGFGFSFPVFLKYRGLPVPPMVRIDQVWSRGGLTAVAHATLPPQGSDHKAVRVGYRF